MNCVFDVTEAEDGSCVYACRRSGCRHSKNGIRTACGKVLAATCSDAESVNESIGAGSELTQILAWFAHSDECACAAKAELMNREGVEWCKANVDVIVSWLMEEWDKRELRLEDLWPKRVPVLVRNLTRGMSREQQRPWAERGARLAVRIAIRRARET